MSQTTPPGREQDDPDAQPEAKPATEQEEGLGESDSSLPEDENDDGS